MIPTRPRQAFDSPAARVGKAVPPVPETLAFYAAGKDRAT